MQDVVTRDEITEFYRVLLPDLPERTVLEIAAAVFQTEEASNDEGLEGSAVLSREAFTRLIGPRGIVEKLSVTLC